MPRFENDYSGAEKRRQNDKRDRTVPNDNFGQIDYNFNNRRHGEEYVDMNSLYENSSKNEYEDFYTGRDDFDEQPRKSRRNPPPKKNKSKKTGQKIIALLAVLLIIFSSLAFSVLGKFNYTQGEKNQYVDSSSLVSGAGVTNVLVLGVDRRSENQTESRSDTMMLVSIDKKHNAIKMTSFLRDTWVYIPCKDTNQRLNAACTYGGYNGVRDTIEYNFGIKIDGYITADFEMFKVIVDSLGGVEVEVTEAEANEVTNHQKRYGGVTLESGTHNLTGEQALAYCRIRKIDTDFMRTQRQRTVMSAMINKVKHSNPISLYSMAKNAAPYIGTSLSKAQLTGFVLSALTCAGDIRQEKVPFDDTWRYANINGNSVIQIDLDENKEKLQEFIYN